MPASPRLQFLAAYYRAQADACHQMAQQASERFSQDWLDLAEKWIKLARHAEAGRFPTAGTMPGCDGGAVLKNVRLFFGCANRTSASLVPCKALLWRKSTLRE